VLTLCTWAHRLPVSLQLLAVVCNVVFYRKLVYYCTTTVPSSIPRPLNASCFLFSKYEHLRPGTHYPHVTWAHVMLRVQLGCERQFDIEFYGADSHFYHSAYVTWSHVELWSAHVLARLSYFCCRTHFVRRDLTWGLHYFPFFFLSFFLSSVLLVAAESVVLFWHLLEKVNGRNKEQLHVQPAWH
jgi:hypothetical protein